MNNLVNKRILLGITGGIAAYKSADLVRRLREQGAEVRVVMTAAACEFITPLTMQALSGNPVHTQLLDPDVESAMGHIALARWADVILIAPASANCLAKLAHGQADDLLSTLCLAAASVPIMLAPAMNQQMWLHPATRANAELLQSRGVQLLGPHSGSQACGDFGPGRLMEPGEIIRVLNGSFQTGLLHEKHIVITAGPTQEAIDPVRYISNRSSGRMGYAVARAAIEAGALVTLVSGPTHIVPPEHASLLQVNSAQEMYDAVMASLNGVDIFIATAAVADYRCEQIALQKMKKQDTGITIRLEKNPDILAAVSSHAPEIFTVGFAAETEDLVEKARKKLQDKMLDLIAANQVGEGLGFDREENRLHVLWNQGETILELAPKEKLARQFIGIVASRYYEKHTTQSH